MKKLVITFAAIAMSVVASAATVKWSGSGAYEMGSTSVKAGANYIAYFIDSSDYSYSSALSDLGNGDIAFVKTYGAAESLFKNNTSGVGTGSAGATITTTAPNSTSYTGYLVILDATSVDAATYAFVTSEQTKTTGATGGAANFSWGSAELAATQTATNWYEVAPEPTSGLMMLLGVGVLALRRRRA